MNSKTRNKSSFLAVVTAICGILILYYFLSSGYYVVHQSQGDWWLHLKGLWLSVLCLFLSAWASNSESLRDGKAGVTIGIIIILVCVSPIIYDSIRKSDLFRPFELAKAFTVDGRIEPSEIYAGMDFEDDSKVMWRPTYKNSDVNYIVWRKSDFFKNNGCGEAKIEWRTVAYRSYSLNETRQTANVCVPRYMFEAAQSALAVGAMKRGREHWGVYIGHCSYEHPSNNLRCIDLETPNE